MAPWLDCGPCLGRVLNFDDVVERDRFEVAPQHLDLLGGVCRRFDDARLQFGVDADAHSLHVTLGPGDEPGVNTSRSASSALLNLSLLTVSA